MVSIAHHPTLELQMARSEKLDLSKILSESEKENRIEYRDPFAPPYGDPNLMTRVQDHAWRFLKARRGLAPIIAMIGAKGAAKTHFGAAFAYHMGQTFPNSMGCVISNALADSERVLTPGGWVRNDSLRAGDLVIGSDGTPTEVLGIFPKGEEQIYRVVFNDGVEVRATGDHLWNVRTQSRGARGLPYLTLSTDQIAADLLDGRGNGKWFVPNVKPVEFPEAALPVPAYTLGAILGDGCIRQRGVKFSTEDPEILNRILAETGATATSHHRPADYGIVFKDRADNPISSGLRALGLSGRGSHDKFIPEVYLAASVEQRLDLLRGLMDTDGHITVSRTGEYVTVSLRMAEGVVDLVRSLGGRTRVREYQNEFGPCYRVQVTLGVNPFYLPRKASRYNTDTNGRGLRRSIVAVIPDGTETATCIKVAAEDSLYVTEGYTLTHNTYTQAKDNGGALIMKLGRQLGYNVRFFQTKTVQGRPYTSLFVIDLDGKGYEDGQNFYILVRSFEAVNKLEGIELDWLWCEEVQDAEKDAFVTVFTRVRGQNADNAVFIAGMPEDELRWMYDVIPNIGAVEEATVREQIGVGPFDVRAFEDVAKIEPEREIALYEADVRGIFFEPCIFENRHNLPKNYIHNLRASLDPELAERWIYGRRTSMRGNKVAHNYEDHTHRRGRMSQILGHYDPERKLYLSVDFNTAPMSATMWQVKRWSDAWLSSDVIFDFEQGKFYAKITGDDGDLVLREISPLEIGVPDRDVLAQVDEFEVWDGGTQGLVEAVMAKYGPNGLNHAAGFEVLGDATGNRKDTRSSTTDWEILTRGFTLPNTIIRQGLVVNSNYKTGEVKFSNPPRRDTINVLNAALRDGLGRVHVCFLYDTPLKSKGAAAAVGMASWRDDGTFDDSNDKKPGRDVVRTHFFDTVRYMVWDFRGGIRTAEDWNEAAGALPEEVVTDRRYFAPATVRDSDSGGWGGLWG